MTIEDLKRWAVATDSVGLVAEIMLTGCDLETALRMAYKIKKGEGK